MGMATCNTHHFNHVLDPFFTKRIGVHNLVGDRQLVIQHIQMAHAGMDVYGFNRITASEVDTVEILRQLQQILTHFTRARNLCANRHIPITRGRRYVAKINMVATNCNLAIWIARGQGKRTGGLAHHLHHKLAVHADIGTVDDTASLFE